MLYKNILLIYAFFGLTGAVLAGPVTLANSVTDFSSIKNTVNNKGFGAWSYGYFTDPTTTFSSVNYAYGNQFSNYWGLGNTFTLLGDSYAHPGVDNSGSSPIDYSPVRRFTDTGYSGPVTFSGAIYKAKSSASFVPDVQATIYKNGSQIYTDQIFADNTGAINYNFSGSINTGDIVDFVLATNQAGSNTNGLTVFTGVITGDSSLAGTPEPATFVAVCSGLAAIAMLGRSRA